MNLDLIYSRPIKTAQQLGDQATDAGRFLSKRVLLTGETHTLVAVTGEDCFLYALRLLVRICPNVSVCVPAGNGNLLRMAEDATNQTVFGNTVSFVSEDIDYKQWVGKHRHLRKHHPKNRFDAVPKTIAACQTITSSVLSGCSTSREERRITDLLEELLAMRTASMLPRS
jgi:hypothetical protein